MNLKEALDSGFIKSKNPIVITFPDRRTNLKSIIVYLNNLLYIPEYSYINSLIIKSINLDCNLIVLGKKDY